MNRHITEIKPHELNSTIYGDSADQELVDSIQKVGILNPLLITETGIIISGHRRYSACLQLNIESVPVIISGLTDENDIIEALIISNKQREKTNEQKAREYRKLKEIEEVRAKERQGERTDIKENFPECNNGQSRDIAANKIGMTGKTAEKANEVLTVIDTLKQTGAEDKAQELTNKLNKSVNGAHNQVKPEIDQAKNEIKEAKKAKHIIEQVNDNIFVAKVNNPNYKASVNAVNDNIEWAKWSWNPVTGCLHPCQYCYARAKAENDYYKDAFPTQFKPTFWPDRLKAFDTFRLPEQRKNEPGIKNVFVCSMADLFGGWVPADWIQQAIDTIGKRPDLNFLFLTKNPKRYLEFEFPKNAWLGATADNQEHFDNSITSFREMGKKGLNHNCIFFLSCEPLIEEIFINSEITSVDEHSKKVYWSNDLDCIDWIIIGGLKNSENTDRQPKWAWAESLLIAGRNVGCKIYFKPNLTIRPIEYPTD